HDPVVIEHSEKGGNKKDGRQHLECEKESHRRALRTERTEHELRSLERIAEQAIDGVSGLLEEDSAKFNLQHKDGEHNLQAQTPRNRFPIYRAAVGGEGVGETQHG